MSFFMNWMHSRSIFSVIMTSMLLCRRNFTENNYYNFVYLFLLFFKLATVAIKCEFDVSQVNKCQSDR